MFSTLLPSQQVSPTPSQPPNLQGNTITFSFLLGIYASFTYSVFTSEHHSSSSTSCNTPHAMSTPSKILPSAVPSANSGNHSDLTVKGVDSPPSPYPHTPTPAISNLPPLFLKHRHIPAVPQISLPLAYRQDKYFIWSICVCIQCLVFLCLHVPGVSGYMSI